MPLPPLLSLVLPARDEAGLVEESVRRVSAYLSQTGHPYEIILGDSGSSDGTGDLVRSMDDPNVRVVRSELPGKGRILGLCLARASGRYVGFLDADLEISEEYLGPLLQALEGGADAAIGRKVEIGSGRSLRRRWGSQIFNTLVRLMFSTALNDHQAGCKLFKAGAIRAILPRVRCDGWLWDTEVMVRLLRCRARVVEVPVTLSPSRKSRLSAKTTLQSLWELVRFRLELFSHPATDSLGDPRRRKPAFLSWLG